jgi:Xaa-Pro aminopeptidase
MSTREKVESLRRLMEEQGLSAYLVPSTDPHQSEYVPACWQRRAWLSGFTGSAGDLLITRTDAGLWTDARYFLQADQQLKGSGIRLYKLGEPKVPDLRTYLARTLKEGETLGCDPRVFSMAAARTMEQVLEPSGARMAWVEQNLVDLLWSGRPSLPREPIRLHDVKYAGESVQAKLRAVRKEMTEKRAAAHLVSALDAVAWLANIRGSDTTYNPVAIGHLLVTQKEALLFIEPAKVTETVAKKLAPAITVRPYDALDEHLRLLAGSRAVVWLDEATTSRWAEEALKGCRFIREASPVTKMKAKKNPVQMDGFRAAHARDGVAMARFLCWIDRNVARGGVSEISAAQKLAEFRAELELAQGSSFETISAYGAHGAIIHYGPTERSDVLLKPEGLYLIDSGGQYLDGTIDVTRTVLLGKSVSKEIKERTTRVLKGHINLARSRFPEGTRGIQIDLLARQALWEAGLDYKHGTGHGVGHYLCVHEGPQSITPYRDTGAAFEVGNVLSNEPGFYSDGAYGIRIESMVLVTEDPKPGPTGTKFLRFETLTMVPVDTRLIEPKLLSREEKEWLNGYHKTVFKTVAPRLDAVDRQWLKKACAAI